ncbi:MAG: DNA cytosine methyltransferase [Carnobacterium alterfunditum]
MEILVYKIHELFGGVGAPRKALINLGVNHKAIDYVEIEEKAVRAYNALYDNRYKPQSVVGYNLMADIMVHGSPCQDFSRSGTRLGGNDEDKTRSSLMFETLKIIENLGIWKPKCVVWENVKGVMDKDMIHSFKKYLSRMKKLGYTNSYEVLSAMDFGIPQRRNRVFVVSYLGTKVFDFKKLELKPFRHISEFLEPNVNESQYKINVPSMLNRIEEFNPSAKTKYRTLDVIEDSCWTISTRQDRCPNAGIIKTDEGHYRYLTERECWRLMGFDDEDFENVLREYPSKKGKRNAGLYKLAGNSIVVPVLEAIFKVIIEDGLVSEKVTGSFKEVQSKGA